MDWLTIIHEAVSIITPIAITALVGYLIKKSMFDQASQEAIQAIGAGVTDTWRTYVKEIKDAREDGKLTDEEKKTARERAYKVALETAKGPGLNLLKSWAWPKVVSVIEDYVNKKKSEGKSASTETPEAPKT